MECSRDTFCLANTNTHKGFICLTDRYACMKILHSPDAGTFWPMRIMDCLKSSRSSARSIDGSLAPISSMLYLARMPFCRGEGQEGTGVRGYRCIGRMRFTHGFHGHTASGHVCSNPCMRQTVDRRRGKTTVCAPRTGPWQGSGRSGLPWWAGWHPGAPEGTSEERAGCEWLSHARKQITTQELCLCFTFARICSTSSGVIGPM